MKGWLNVDLRASDYDLDLGCGRLPWADGVFDVVVSQQFIEHLDMHDELLPLLKELWRCCAAGAEVWFACPDMEKVCGAYFSDRGAALFKDRNTRYPLNFIPGQPTQHIVNVVFHQSGQHKNLFDYELIEWLLRASGFSDIRKVSEGDLLRRFPEFPLRGDDAVSLYVRAARSTS